jgi:hypothetical protein
MKMRVLARIAIQRIGAAAIPHLLGALGHRDPEMRRSVVLLLGRLCSPQAASGFVEPLANDSDPGVRDAVARITTRANSASLPGPEDSGGGQDKEGEHGGVVDAVGHHGCDE